MHTKELKRYVSLVLLNTHVTLGSPRPYAQNMIEVDGMHKHIDRDVKPSPANFQKFSNDAKDSATFFSLGSNVQLYNCWAQWNQLTSANQSSYSFCNEYHIGLNAQNAETRRMYPNRSTVVHRFITRKIVEKTKEIKVYFDKRLFDNTTETLR